MVKRPRKHFLAEEPCPGQIRAAFLEDASKRDFIGCSSAGSYRIVAGHSIGKSSPMRHPSRQTTRAEIGRDPARVARTLEPGAAYNSATAIRPCRETFLMTAGFPSSVRRGEHRPSIMCRGCDRLSANRFWSESWAAHLSVRPRLGGVSRKDAFEPTALADSPGPVMSQDHDLRRHTAAPPDWPKMEAGPLHLFNRPGSGVSIWAGRALRQSGSASDKRTEIGSVRGLQRIKWVRQPGFAGPARLAPCRARQCVIQVRTTEALPLRGDEPSQGILQAHGRQFTRPIGARVDTDPVVPRINLARFAVTVDNDRAMIPLAVQEFPADPKEVLPALTFEPDARPHPGMAKEVISASPGQREAAQPVHHVRANLLLKRETPLLRRKAHERTGIEAIAAQGGVSAAFEPEPLRLGVTIRAGEKHLLVIAAKNHDPAPIVPLHQLDQFEHLPRVRPAIDEIAQKDDPCRASAARSDVGFQLPQQLLQEIEPPVDVADGVDPRAW